MVKKHEWDTTGRCEEEKQRHRWIIVCEYLENVVECVGHGANNVSGWSRATSGGRRSAGSRLLKTEIAIELARRPSASGSSRAFAAAPAVLDARCLRNPRSLSSFNSLWSLRRRRRPALFAFLSFLDPTMPPPRSIVAGGLPASSSLSPLDDDDDICPVCDGECTCRTRAGPSSKPAPAPSASSSAAAPPASALPQKQRQPPPSAPYPLKIKLTVPPNLKFRKLAAASSSSEPRRPPPKGVPKLKAKYPTFIPAGSTSSHTSSPESSDFDSDDTFGSSDDDDDERFVPRSHHGKGRPKKQPLGDDSGQKRRDHALNNRWELKPRKMSVGPEDADVDADSEDTSAEDNGADDEDDGNEEDDEAEAEVEADVEADAFPELDEDPVGDEADGKLGVSFGGVPTGWSEDDEESSFDADLFFANLDDSSDSCSSPSALRNDAFASDFETDPDASFSADEEDALLLMNVDPTVQVRRTNGEFEFGVELDGLSFGWDGQLMLPPPLHAVNSLDLELFNGTTESDVDMTASDGGSTTEDQAVRWSDDQILDETDGETTEDELVDSDGLPNPRAMKLFRWPPAVSAIDPASTLSPTCRSPTSVLPNASQTTRIALATMSAQRGSPAPTPADILAGKISLDDLDDIEINNGHHRFEETSSSTRSSRRMQAHPLMGQFIAEPQHAQRRAVINGSGQPIPSPFPSRIRRIRLRSALGHASTDSHEVSTVRLPASYFRLFTHQTATGCRVACSPPIS